MDFFWLGVEFAPRDLRECNLEDTLYDEFLKDFIYCMRPGILAQMYAACNDGETAPAHLLEGRRDGETRPCKKYFAACLAAMGGKSKKKNQQIYWTNIRNRDPRHPNSTAPPGSARVGDGA